jgi:hypothetical protein
MNWAEHQAPTAVDTRAYTRSRGTAPRILNYHTTTMELSGQFPRPGPFIPGERTIDTH